MTDARTYLVGVVLGAALAWPGPATAQMVPTQIMVRVIAHDAKIIGSGVGGARVTVRNADTGRVLAEGRQEGSTGDTRKIMLQPVERGATVYDTEGAAGFMAEVSIGEPTTVEIVAEGPLGTPHAMQRASKTMLIVPGRHVLGEGVILELMGFTVVIEAPDGNARPSVGGEFEVRANVTMLCGCPTNPGGTWNADEIDILARIVRDGSVVREFPLKYAGVRSTYTGRATLDRSGPVELQVLAMDSGKGNFGIAKRIIHVGN